MRMGTIHRVQLAETEIVEVNKVIHLYYIHFQYHENRRVYYLRKTMRIQVPPRSGVMQVANS